MDSAPNEGIFCFTTGSVINGKLSIEKIQEFVAEAESSCRGMEITVKCEHALIEEKIAGENIASRFSKFVEDSHFDLWPYFTFTISVHESEKDFLLAVAKVHGL